MEIGDIVFSAGATRAHALVCDGSAVSRTTYAALYAVIGTTFGAGNGTTTFNLPDAQGRAALAKGIHTDVSTLGNSDGLANASRTPKHTHPQNLNATATVGGVGSTPIVAQTNAATGDKLYAGSTGDGGGSANKIVLTGVAAGNSGYLVVGNLFIVYE